MYPSLLLMHPDVAESVVEYRRKTHPRRARTTRATTASRASSSRGTAPAPATSGQECHSWDPPHCLTQIHLQGDIALAVWQYYLATGDTGWLRSHWSLLRGIAEFWAGRRDRQRRRQLLDQERRRARRVLQRRRRRRLHQRRRGDRAAQRHRGRGRSSASRCPRSGRRSPTACGCRSTRRTRSSCSTTATRAR